MRIGFEPLGGRWDAHQLEQLHGAGTGFGAAGLAMAQDGLDDLLSHGEGGIERGHGVLEDHADLVAANVAQGGGIERHQILAVEMSGAGFDAAAGLEQAQDGHAGDGLARAGFSHDAQDLAGMDVETHPAHGLHFPAPGEEAGRQVADGKDGRAHLRNRGSSASRSPSPRKLKANMVSEMAAAGKKSWCG